VQRRWKINARVKRNAFVDAPVTDGCLGTGSHGREERMYTVSQKCIPPTIILTTIVRF